MPLGKSLPINEFSELIHLLTLIFFTEHKFQCQTIKISNIEMPTFEIVPGKGDTLCHKLDSYYDDDIILQ